MEPFLAAEAEARLKQKAADEAAAKKASEEAKKGVRDPSEPELTDAQIDSQFELIAVNKLQILALTNSLFSILLFVYAYSQNLASRETPSPR